MQRGTGIENRRFRQVDKDRDRDRKRKIDRSIDLLNHWETDIDRKINDMIGRCASIDR